MVLIATWPIWPPHRRLADVRRSLLDDLNRRIANAPPPDPGHPETLVRLAPLLTDRREILDVSEWPFHLGTMTRLGLYSSSPPREADPRDLELVEAERRNPCPRRSCELGLRETASGACRPIPEQTGFRPLILRPEDRHDPGRVPAVRGPARRRVRRLRSRRPARHPDSVSGSPPLTLLPRSHFVRRAPGTQARSDRDAARRASSGVSIEHRATRIRTDVLRRSLPPSALRLLAGGARQRVV